MDWMILRLPDVKRTTGLSRSTIYVRIAQGTFPKPVSLGGRAVGWLESEIQEWLQNRIDESRTPAGAHRAVCDGSPAAGCSETSTPGKLGA